MVMGLVPITKVIDWLALPDTTELPLTVMDALLARDVGVTVREATTLGTLPV